MQKLNDERVVEILRESGVLMEGHFQLTSGRHSDKYMQCAKILQYPRFAGEILEGLAAEFVNDNIDVVIGPAVGAIIIAYELAKVLNCKNMFAERENGVMTLRRGFEIPEGARVLVCEDTVTTGGSVIEVINLVKERGGIVAGVAVIVDRSNGAVDFGSKLVSAYSKNIQSFTPEECPICNEGKIPVYKPGSRALK